jgi:hypothetical protein
MAAMAIVIELGQLWHGRRPLMGGGKAIPAAGNSNR